MTAGALPSERTAIPRRGAGRSFARASEWASACHAEQRSPIGRGVVTDELGVFTLPIPDVSDEQRKVILAAALGLRFTGRGGAIRHLTVPVPAAGSQALGQLALDAALEPLPESVVGALIDLVGDLPVGGPGGAPAGSSGTPVKIQVGEAACNIVFEEDVTLRRFPYQILVRLIEPRTTTVNRVFIPRRPLLRPRGRPRNPVVMPLWNPALLRPRAEEHPVRRPRAHRQAH